MGDYVDFHTHTTYSDGVLSPGELLAKAKSRGLKAISITDHDSVDGCIEAHSIASEYEVEVIDGCEFSCYEENKEYHILGYFFDLDNKDIKKALIDFTQARHLRAEKIIKKLQRLSLPITLNQVEEKAGKAPLARPHIATVLVENGIVSSLKEGFINYLIEGKPAYEPKKAFTIKQCVNLINQAGGIAILAHPGKYLSQDDLYEIIRTGIDGIEIIHPSHDNQTQKFYKNITSHYWLLETGGSDFHGNRDYDDDNFGKFKMPYSTVASIKYHTFSKSGL